jgi:hypothetical protein
MLEGGCMEHDLRQVSLKDTLQLVAVADITHDRYYLGWGYNLGQFVLQFEN